MRLLVLIPSTDRGGAEEYALTISSAAVKRGWEVHSAFSSMDKMSTLIHDFKSSGILYHQLNIGDVGREGGGWKWRQFIRMFRVLTALCRIKPDVTHIVLPSAKYGLGLMLACGMLRIPTVVVFQYIQRKHYFSKRYLLIYGWARSRGQKWVAVSENNRQLLAESFHVPHSEIKLIYNGAKVSEGCFDDKKRKTIYERIRKELGLNIDHKILLTVAALRSQKGYEYLIPTIPKILKEFPEARWLWVGEGEQRDKLIEMLEDHGIEKFVILLGYRKDVPDLLYAADLFVFPTKHEGFPFALIEAMAAGLPIVTTDASGIPELVQHMKQGVVCRKKDSYALLEGMRYALRNPEKVQKMANSAKYRAQEFSEDKMIEQTLNMFFKLTDSKPKKVRKFRS